MSETKRHTLRVPKELDQRIAALAQQEERSLNGQYVHLLKKAVEQAEKERGE